MATVTVAISEQAATAANDLAVAHDVSIGEAIERCVTDAAEEERLRAQVWGGNNYDTAASDGRAELPYPVPEEYRRRSPELYQPEIEAEEATARRSREKEGR